MTDKYFIFDIEKNLFKITAKFAELKKKDSTFYFACKNTSNQTFDKFH